MIGAIKLHSHKITRCVKGQHGCAAVLQLGRGVGGGGGGFGPARLKVQPISTFERFCWLRRQPAELCHWGTPSK